MLDLERCVFYMAFGNKNYVADEVGISNNRKETIPKNIKLILLQMLRKINYLNTIL